MKIERLYTLRDKKNDDILPGGAKDEELDMNDNTEIEPGDPGYDPFAPSDVNPYIAPEEAGAFEIPAVPLPDEPITEVSPEEEAEMAEAYGVEQQIEINPPVPPTPVVGEGLTVWQGALLSLGAVTILGMLAALWGANGVAYAFFGAALLLAVVSIGIGVNRNRCRQWISWTSAGVMLALGSGLAGYRTLNTPDVNEEQNERIAAAEEQIATLKACNDSLTNKVNALDVRTDLIESSPRGGIELNISKLLGDESTVETIKTLIDIYKRFQNSPSLNDRLTQFKEDVRGVVPREYQDQIEVFIEEIPEYYDRLRSMIPY